MSGYPLSQLAIRVLLLSAACLFTSEAALAKRSVTELPEVLVESRHRNMLHVLAYVREYSTLTTYRDTVFLFREKMVDFMLPANKKSGYRGWRIPRVIRSESYYRFTDDDGLDSVSDMSRHNFSWSDWIGLPPEVDLPSKFSSAYATVDTLHGRYSPVEIWRRDRDLFTVEVNVLADTAARRWVPNLRSFMNDENVEIEDLKLKAYYANVLGDRLTRRDLTHFTYRLDADGRGHDMFRFNHRGQSYFATTEGEVYVLDMEYISEKEAKKWGKGKYDSEEVELIRSAEAPPLSDDIYALMDRVEHIDKNLIILNHVPDRSLMRMERKRSKGQKALRYLKNITGISDMKADRNRRDSWDKFRERMK